MIPVLKKSSKGENMQDKIRDIPSTILLTVAIVASVLTILNAVSLSMGYASDENASSSFEYGYTYRVVYEYPQTDGYITLTDEAVAEATELYGELIDELTGFTSANITLEAANKIGSAYETYYTYVVLADSEGLKYKLAEGDGFSDTANSNEVLIGESLSMYTYTEDGQTKVDIEGMPFLVVGTLKNDAASGMDERAVINWASLDDAAKEDFLDDTVFYNYLTVLVDTDADGDTAKNEFLLLADELGLSVEEDELESNTGSIDLYYTFVKGSVLVVAVIFSVCSCLAASAIWVHRRNRELVIRRVFGYSMGDIVALLIRELAPKLLFGLVSGVIIFLLFSLCNGSTLIIGGSGFVYALAGIIGGILLILIIVLAIPIAKIAEEKPADAFHV